MNQTDYCVFHAYTLTKRAHQNKFMPTPSPHTCACLDMKSHK